MTKDEWEAIKSNSVENIVLYNAELRDNKSSSLPISTEFKTIIDSYRAEYDIEVNELHSFLKSNRSTGCLITLFLFMIFTISIWLMF